MKGKCDRFYPIQGFPKTQERGQEKYRIVGIEVLKMEHSMYQVVLNQSWDWATLDQKIWYFAPVNSLQDAELQAQSMLARGSALIYEIGLACCL